jgi:hypothetical protein
MQQKLCFSLRMSKLFAQSMGKQPNALHIDNEAAWLWGQSFT